MNSTCAYLDLEANAITNEVISIGLVTETGDTYYSLIRPHTKLDRRIKELTGITQQEAEVAPTIEEVMQDIKNFLAAHPAINLFYCYGGSDRMFLKASRQYSSDVETQNLLDSLRLRCFDVSEYVSFKFHQGAIGLRSAYLTMHLAFDMPATQNHNALEDAEMLKWVWEHIEDYEIPVGVEPIRVEKPNMCYGRKSGGDYTDPLRAFTGKSNVSRKRQLHAAIPEAADPKYCIPIKATKRANGKENHYQVITSALPLVAPKVKTPQEMFDAMELIYSVLDTGVYVHGWKFEKV